jgi:hypothetical protein
MINNNMRKDYRKIYITNHGTIPIDTNGRSYDIHHIDGNHENNDPTNLVAVSIQEHYDIHYSQKDWGACHKISLRMKLSPEELSQLATNSNLERVQNGTHPWVGGDLSRKRVANGTHNFLGASNPVHKKIADGTHHWFDGRKSSETQRKLLTDGTHHFLGENHPSRVRASNGTHHFFGGDMQRKTQRRLVEEGTHHLLGGEIQRQGNIKALQAGRHPSQIKKTCEHCNNVYSIGMYNRWHGDKCKATNLTK